MAFVLNHKFPFFGQRLRRVRRAMGVKQFALAQSLGVDQTTISRWESSRQTPDADLQKKALDTVSSFGTDDRALRRLIEHSTTGVHLVDEASHKCLAYSPTRATSWGASPNEWIGTSLWQFATDEIRQAEEELDAMDWWSLAAPEPKVLYTSAASHDRLRIDAGKLMWERLYLADGTPVRLTSSL
ncbi:helix-turn-helix domain-containing protein [Cochlodiniinecator piscidefendens]|uniref:helix-turn-helix domain-containing protein n=1 Tax=Cochlodiniinecator piscidefendens TaxID=2715756 RepID=UPI00140C00DF|nr:helix-turn-helix domain-containing protein [Cochlodiniinecator piscidefendens]